MTNDRRTIPPQPLVSDDGRFYLDGDRWVPLPVARDHSRVARQLAVFLVGIFTIPWIVYAAFIVAFAAAELGPAKHETAVTAVVFVSLLVLLFRGAFVVVRRDLRS